MNTIVRTRIIKIGSSPGIRIPKAVLEKLGVGAEVELEVQEKKVSLLFVLPLIRARIGMHSSVQWLHKGIINS